MTFTHRFKMMLRRRGLDIYHAPTIKITAPKLDAFRLFDRMYAHIQGVPGDIVECGVGTGTTFLFLSYLASQDELERSCWGFDSFAGFPEPSVADTSARNPKKGEWAGTDPNDIHKLLKYAYIPETFRTHNVHLVKGFFEDTLDHYTGEQIAFLHLDADLYDSYKVVLETLFPKVAPGGVVLFNEYGEAAWPGATKAVDAFLKDTTYTLQHDSASGKYFVIKE